MILEGSDIIMAFTSHNRALYMYEHLIKMQINIKLVSAPYNHNISCTQAIKFKETDLAIVQRELKRNNVFPTAVYRFIENGKKISYEELL